MRTRTPKHLAASLLLLIAVLAGCQKDETDSKRPLTLTATVDGLAATRATTDNTWTDGQAVALRIARETKKYTAAANGTLTVAAGTPFYWTSIVMSAEAWVPYSAVKPTTFTVEADQHTDGYQQSDILFASATISYIDSELEFEHLPAKVMMNLTNGAGITQADVAAATVTLVNQTLTSGTIADDWTVTPVATGPRTILPNTLAAPTIGFQKTLQALVVPQQSAGIMPLIKVVVAGQEFVYATASNFAAGQQYTYTITVRKNGLTVTSSGAQAWTGTTTNVTSKEVVASFTASDLKIGDYYYSNGTTSDGGVRKLYADETFATEDIAPVTGTVVGIVFKVGKDNSDLGDYKDMNGGDMSTINGYVVALQDAGSELAWANKGGVSEFVVGTSTGDNDWQGYSNCQKMKGGEADQDWSITDFPAANACLNFGTIYSKYAAPAGSSSWFLPSTGQLKHLYDNRNVLSQQIKKLKDIFGMNDISWFSSNIYWSSSEDKYGFSNAWRVNFGDGNVKAIGKSNGIPVRSLLAF